MKTAADSQEGGHRFSHHHTWFSTKQGPADSYDTTCTVVGTTIFRKLTNFPAVQQRQSMLPRLLRSPKDRRHVLALTSTDTPIFALEERACEKNTIAEPDLWRHKWCKSSLVPIIVKKTNGESCCQVVVRQCQQLDELMRKRQLLSTEYIPNLC